MKEINIAKIIAMRRREKGVTQDELASYIGVTKASVSKWETGFSYPDIVLLPKLATYFNISIDELMGYTSQLAKEDIQKVYQKFTEEFAVRPFMEVWAECQSMIKKYYSCFPFLLHMAILYLNHHMLAENREQAVQMLEEAYTLCEKVREESLDVELTKDAVIFEAFIYQTLGKPQKVLDLLGEQIKPDMSGANMIISAFQMLGNTEKAKRLSQIYIYNHVNEILGMMPGYMNLYADDSNKLMETINRTCKLIDIYNLESVQPNAAAVFYFQAAVILSKRGDKEEAYHMIKRYQEVCMKELKDVSLHGDAFFDLLDDWFEEGFIGKAPPRNKKAIRADIVSGLFTDGVLDELKEDKRYQKMAKELKDFMEDES